MRLLDVRDGTGVGMHAEAPDGANLLWLHDDPFRTARAPLTVDELESPKRFFLTRSYRRQWRSARRAERCGGRLTCRALAGGG